MTREAAARSQADVQRLCRLAGLPRATYHRHVAGRHDEAGDCELRDLRGLVPSAPDQIWVADITYVHLARSFAYLAVILDAFSSKAVGWAFEDTLDASLAVAALDTDTNVPACR